MASSLEDFFRQQDAIFSMPDETIQEYHERSAQWEKKLAEASQAATVRHMEPPSSQLKQAEDNSSKRKTSEDTTGTNQIGDRSRKRVRIDTNVENIIDKPEQTAHADTCNAETKIAKHSNLRTRDSVLKKQPLPAKNPAVGIPVASASKPTSSASTDPAPSVTTEKLSKIEPSPQAKTPVTSRDAVLKTQIAPIQTAIGVPSSSNSSLSFYKSYPVPKPSSTSTHAAIAGPSRPSSSLVPGKSRVPQGRKASTSRTSRYSVDSDSTDGSDCARKRAAPPSPPDSPNKRRGEQASISKGKAPAVSKASGSRVKTGVKTTLPEDPLAEFYEQARKDRDAAEDPDDLLEFQKVSSKGKGKATKRVFTCDRKGPPPTCVNQDIIDKLQQLKDLHQAKPGEEDKWRVFSYGKSIGALRRYPKRITSYEEAKKIPGVGEKTAKKIMEIIETGELKRIRYEDTEDVRCTAIFQRIYGVGRQTAFQWYAAGCRKLDDVKTRKGGIKLSSAQEIGLKHYDDINDRMPRAEAQEIFDKVKAIALECDKKLFVKIMGSFRRGKADCGDIDILISRPTDDGFTHYGILRRLLRKLHKQGILTEDLSIPEDLNSLEAVYRGLCRRDENSKRRRIDFLTVPWKSRGAALLYYTGDDIFNRAMRYKANVMGYSLNQRGLYAGVVRDPRNRMVKLNEGNIVASETEEEIFKILGVPWQEPHERIRS